MSWPPVAGVTKAPPIRRCTEREASGIAGGTPVLPVLKAPLQKGLFLLFQPRARPQMGGASTWLLLNHLPVAGPKCMHHHGF